MSKEAVKWAMDDAPMLLTEKGKPDTTARHVLQALAEHAHPDGSGAHPSVLRIQYRTGYDRATVQRALRRLEKGGLIRRDGSVDGRTRWRLAMEQCRPASDWKELEREEEAGRAAAAERKRRSRARNVTHPESVTVTHAESVTGEMSRTQSPSVTHSKSVRHARNAALTTNQPSQPSPSTPTDVTAEQADPDGGRDEQQHPDPLARAAAFLEDLPHPWAVGPKTAAEYAPLLLDRARAQGWRPDAALAAKLTERPGGIDNYPAVLRIRIKDLPKAPVVPTQRPADPQPALPPYCGHIDCDEKTRMRDIELDTGHQVITPCPECHPNSIRKGAAA